MSALNGRVVLFAGAGASKAVRPDKFPTTKEFFDELLPPITEQPLFQFAIEYLTASTKQETIDIEQVLWALQTLRDFYYNVTTKNSVIGFSFRKNLIERLYPRHNAGHLTNLAPGLQGQLDTLIGEINQIVYDLYSYEPTIKEIDNNWVDLIEKFDGVGNRLDIFTTNYDVIIEVALSHIMGDVTGKSWRGIRGNVRQTIDLGHWTDRSLEFQGLLTKLHGSLDWKLQGQDIHVGDAVFTGDHKKQAIIYPGFKGASGAPFFDAFHSYLSDSLSEAAAAIFIGFAFRDEHISQIIRESTNRNCKVVVINPDKSVKFPRSRATCHYMNHGFDRSSVAMLADYLEI